MQLYIRTEPTPPTALSSSPSPATPTTCLCGCSIIPITSITFAGQVIPLSVAVIILGVSMDSHLTFDTHIKNLCKNSFNHLRNFAKLRLSLSLPVAEKLLHAFVSSRRDYCNALLIGLPSKSICKLQCIQNSAARILMWVHKYDHITPS